MKIACIQHAYKGTKDLTHEYVEEQIVKACTMGAKVICLQELFSLPYFCQEMDSSFFAFAESIPGETTDYFSGLSKRYQVVLIVPVFEKRMNGLYCNSVVVIDADGKILGSYQKIHIPDDPCFCEKYYFSGGDSGYKVFQTRFCKIGVLLCWDQWFPEASRILSLMEADIIFYPTAIGILDDEADLKNRFIHAWKTIQLGAAIANGVFVAAVNRTGNEGRISFWGNSFICDPMGEILSSCENDESIISSDIDLDLIQETRITWPFLRDRRIDTYQPILNKKIST